MAAHHHSQAGSILANASEAVVALHGVGHACARDHRLLAAVIGQVASHHIRVGQRVHSTVQSQLVTVHRVFKSVALHLG